MYLTRKMRIKKKRVGKKEQDLGQKMDSPSNTIPYRGSIIHYSPQLAAYGVNS